MLNEAVPKANRFVDLFTGSAAVATFVAQNHDVGVIANDLQSYSKILAASVITRIGPINGQEIWDEWVKAVSANLCFNGAPPFAPLSLGLVRQHREYSRACRGSPITQAYGGHYFSVQQALEFDAFRKTTSANRHVASLQLAALIVAASQCVASPGHTAQPFQPSETGIVYIQEAWRRSASERIQRSLFELSARYAKREGIATLADANAMAETCLEGDLVFVDPPYSGVHYSRFYHVLETIAHGDCGDVSGKGRYPSQEKRPRSSYSMKSQSLAAIDDLFAKLAKCGATAAVTFPDRECSNGISGSDVRGLAKRYFQVAERVIETKFSSMGGRGDGESRQAGRNARVPTNEILFHLT